MVKKSIYIALLAMSLNLGTSCSKSYNCHCVYKTNGAVSHEDDHKISEGSREKSAAACDQGDSVSASSAGSTTFANSTECELTN